MALIRLVVDAVPKIVLAAVTAKAASPAGELGTKVFAGPNVSANALLPFSLPNANARPKASLANTTRLKPCCVAYAICGGRNAVVSLVISAELPTAPYIDASTAIAGVVV